MTHKRPYPKNHKRIPGMPTFRINCQTFGFDIDLTVEADEHGNPQVKAKPVFDFNAIMSDIAFLFRKK